MTGDALDFALETLGLDDPQLRVRLMDLYRTLDAFPEVPEMLKRGEGGRAEDRDPVERLAGHA